MDILKPGIVVLLALAIVCAACSAKEELSGQQTTTTKEAGGSAPKAQEKAPASPAPAAPATAFASAVGKYELSLEPDASWHHNTLEIKSADEKGISGNVSIDLGIGPEGRAPMPDEKIHTVGFRATLDKSPTRLRFSVTVGQDSPALYTFDLHICPDAGAQRCAEVKDERIVGEVVVESKRAGRDVLKAEARRLD